MQENIFQKEKKRGGEDISKKIKELSLKEEFEGFKKTKKEKIT